MGVSAATLPPRFGLKPYGLATLDRTKVWPRLHQSTRSQNCKIKYVVIGQGIWFRSGTLITFSRRQRAVSICASSVTNTADCGGWMHHRDVFIITRGLRHGRFTRNKHLSASNSRCHLPLLCIGVVDPSHPAGSQTVSLHRLHGTGPCVLLHASFIEAGVV